MRHRRWALCSMLASAPHAETRLIRGSPGAVTRATAYGGPRHQSAVRALRSVSKEA
jgi:hypothetical protein